MASIVELVPEGARFALVRHVLQNPKMLIVMVALMLAVMAAAMMMMR